MLENLAANAGKESPRKMYRRELLQKLGAGAIVLGFSGLGATLESGCAPKKMGLKNEEIASGLERFSREIEDPRGYLKLLVPREYVLQDEIFEAYARTVEKRKAFAGASVGGYMSKNYLDRNEEKIEFRNRLAELELSSEEIGFYEQLFTSTDVIIFREALLKKNFFLKALPHERMHKKLKYLKDEERAVMEEAAKEIALRRDDNDEPTLKENESRLLMENALGFCVSAAMTNWEEFYTYLAQGEFDEAAEEELKNSYPQAYKIFIRIRSECELKR